MDMRNKIKEKFGEHCFILRLIPDKNRMIISDGEYEYEISSNKRLETKKLTRELMTHESRIKCFQKDFPDRLILKDITKENKHYPTFYVYDKISGKTFKEFFYYDAQNLIDRVFLKIRCSIKIEDLIYEKYGKSILYIEDDPDKRNNVIVTDGEYSYSVTKSRFRATKLNVRSMTYESYIKYHNDQLPKEISVLSIKNIDGKKYKQIELIYHPNGRIFKTDYNRWEGKIVKTILDAAEAERKFFRKCKEKYGDTFSYKKTKYISYYNDIIVTCKIHGDFSIKPSNFLKNMHGCPQCGMESRFAFSRKSFTENCKNNTGYIYVIRCYNDEESFIKVGITSKSNIKERFATKDSMPYVYEVLLFEKSHPNIIFFTEHVTHVKLRNEKHKPQISFKGSGECFSTKATSRAILIVKDMIKNCPYNMMFRHLLEEKQLSLFDLI